MEVAEIPQGLTLISPQVRVLGIFERHEKGPRSQLGRQQQYSPQTFLGLATANSLKEW